MNVLVLLAGPSDSFAEAGFAYPKNLVEVEGSPLVERVLPPLGELTRGRGKLICMIRKDESRRFHTGEVIRLLRPEAVVLETEETSGAACTALLAVEYINNDEPLLIANGDQILDLDLESIIQGFHKRELDGGILVFEAVHPRWSYVKTNAAGYVVEAAEKKPISNLATAGTYYFARGSDFVRATTNMIRKGASVGDLYYICPSFNELILEQKKIGIHMIDRNAYHSLATPQGIQMYESHLRETAQEPSVAP